MRISRRNLLGAAAGRAVLPGVAEAAQVAGYPAPISEIPFGAQSHWLQPWKGLCTTRPAGEINAGVGVVVSGYNAPQEALDMLRANGFRNVRMEIGWGQLDAKSETMFQNQAGIAGYFGRLRQAGLRPLILLNGNDGNPCPSVFFNVQVTQDAAEGARTLVLADASALVVGRSGFRAVKGQPSGYVLVAGVNGTQVQLSKPLPAGIAAGSSVAFVTLNYEPFSKPGSPGNERTMQGWLRYVAAVARLATEGLGTGDAADKGFDLEIWNELTFGSRFLQINDYYDPPHVDYNFRDTWADIVTRTAAMVAEGGEKYQGVQISDGFADTIPWPASSLEPPRVSAISKHPYPRDLVFPRDQQPHAIALDAAGQKTRFIPSYKAYFPEYLATVLQTESLCRDIGDAPNKINRYMHGRLARQADGKASPVDVWITETGCLPSQVGVHDPIQAERMMTVFLLRSMFFFLGIGARRVYLFNAFGAPGSMALVDESSAETASAPVVALGRALKAVGDGGGSVVPVSWTVMRAPNDEVLFQGDNSADLPSLTTTDCVTLLPIQAGAGKIAIVYYVMTLDIRNKLDAQRCTVQINAADIQNYAVSSYDPVTDTTITMKPSNAGLNQVTFTLLPTDVPQVLVFSR